jgi:hypothetical protein
MHINRGKGINTAYASGEVSAAIIHTARIIYVSRHIQFNCHNVSDASTVNAKKTVTKARGL